MAKNEDYSLTLHSGGFMSYDGVMSSSKEVKKIEVNKNDGKVVVIYEDGHKYTYMADVKKTENGFEITSEIEIWK